MLLGWIAGTMALSDPAVQNYLPQTLAWRYGFGLVGAIGVWLVGAALKKHRQAPL